MRTGRFFVVNAVVALAVGIAGMLAGRALLRNIDRGKLKRDVADMRSIATCMEQYAAENKQYPTTDSIEGLAALLAPRYIRSLPTRDYWNNAFQIHSSATSYTLYSLGKDGLGSNCAPGTTTRLTDEICVVDGRFVRAPKFD
ncbi:MAG TPA: type II secretion system protein GspG [Candidatus Polarisedimenticolaceae bacterium]|nr:type II secretion system protein GspG [Candidatus Polarisedimenticolaceae bacterium]